MADFPLSPPQPADCLVSRGALDDCLTPDDQRECLIELLAFFGPLRRVLVLAPDITRLHSGAGLLTAQLYTLLHGHTHIDILPTLGTHAPMTPAELDRMYPGIPHSCFHVHRWREDVEHIGTVPVDLLAMLSCDRFCESIDVAINRLILAPRYDLILSIGQVVPHEVIGMANHVKNIFIGAGGKDMLDKSHFLGALHGMERIMGRTDTPVRQIMDWASERFLNHLPLCYVQTVLSHDATGTLRLRGLFAGPGRAPFLQAAALSRRVNLTLLPTPLAKVVVYLDPQEFRTAWLGNKALYRTRMAMAEGGELVVLAPGIHRFGEDSGIDHLIRRFGYRGTSQTLRQVANHPDLHQNLAAAAHLIHGSTEGRFRMRLAPGGLTRSEVEAVGFAYSDLKTLLARYNPDRMTDGWNTVEGEEIFFIRHPGLGLWALERDFPPLPEPGTEPSAPF